MSADDRVLLENIAVNIKDQTNFPLLPEIVNVAILPKFACMYWDSWYAVIVLGKSNEDNAGIGIHARVPIEVNICQRILKSPDLETAVPDMMDKLEEVRKALVRPDPYGNHKPDATYTAMAGCHGVMFMGFDEPEMYNEYIDGEQGDPQLVGSVYLEYHMIRARS